jgi:hypothetical protein
MKAIHRWHHSAWGRTARFLGSINLAVPVLVFVAAALAWGTYLESAHNVRVARATVYGSWWFIALMALVCVSLVFAVITRFPWKRKHVGFITVHAGLIMLIVGGFWSLFGRIEGQLPLEAGTTSNVLTTETEQVEVVRHQNGQFEPLSAAQLEYGRKTLTLGAIKLDVLGRWDNSREEAYVENDAPAPLRAVELSLDPSTPDTIWVGEESHGSSATVSGGLRIRVLPAGVPWLREQAAPSADSPYVFVQGDKTISIPEQGAEIIPGWKVESVRRFDRAMVTASGLEESAGGRENQAIEIILADASGSREQHRAFLDFPDMVMTKALAGQATSGLQLLSRGPTASAPQPVETLIIHGQPPALEVAYIAPDKSVQELKNPGQLPWSFKVGARSITIQQQFTNARAASRLVEAPKSNENRPALLVRLPGQVGAEPIPLLWREPTPLPIAVPDGQDPVMVRFGPRLVSLPFAIKLTEFRKVDYPGTEMAMSYESDVSVTMPDGSSKNSTISMNQPFKGEGWKVYQSGFIGSNVSVFSIMKDPGLPMTYIGCITLCIGIALTFYSRALSTGHPGIPALFGNSRKENGNGSHVPSVSDRDDAPAPADSAGADQEPELVAAGR